MGAAKATFDHGCRKSIVMYMLLDGVEVQTVAGRGRGVVATRDIRSGETVLTDLPTFIVCNYADSYCSNCLRDLTTPGPREGTLTGAPSTISYWNGIMGAWA